MEQSEIDELTKQVAELTERVKTLEAQMQQQLTTNMHLSNRMLDFQPREPVGPSFAFFPFWP